MIGRSAENPDDRRRFMKAASATGLGLVGAADRISAARDSLDGTVHDDQGISRNHQVNIVPTDGNSQVFGRTPGQVLNVVYLTPKPAKTGGFFPAGVNGTLNESA